MESAQLTQNGATASLTTLIDGFAYDLEQAANGLETGFYDSFQQTVDTAAAIYNDPRLVTYLSINIMNALTDPSLIADGVKDVLKSAKEHFQYFMSAAAQEKGQLLGELAGNIVQAMAGGESFAAGKKTLEGMATRLGNAKPSALGQTLVNELAKTPFIMKDESRATMATSLVNRTQGNMTNLIPVESPAHVYKTTLENALTTHKDATGILGSTSPITKIADALENNQLKHHHIDGYFYEIETANKLHAQGHKVEAFGVKLYAKELGVPREFDLVTLKNGQKTLVECKNIDWGRAKMESKFGVLVQQHKIAQKLGYSFEVHSKTAVPEIWQAKFREHGITLIQD